MDPKKPEKEFELPPCGPMKSSSLAFLETREARLLAAAWPRHFETAEDPDSCHMDYERWLKGAGLFPLEAAGQDDDEQIAKALGSVQALALAPALLVNGICRQDGTLDPDAAAFIKQAAYAAAGVKIGDLVPTLISPGYATGGRVDRDSTKLELRETQMKLEEAKAKLERIEAERAIRPDMDSWCDLQNKLRATEAARRFYAAVASSSQKNEKVLTSKVRAIEEERDAARTVVREMLANKAIVFFKGDESTVDSLRGDWSRRAGIEAIAPKHPGDVGSSIPHAPFDPSGHASGCNAFACVSHCKQPRKTPSPKAGC